MCLAADVLIAVELVDYDAEDMCGTVVVRQHATRLQAFRISIPYHVLDRLRGLQRLDRLAEATADGAQPTSAVATTVLKVLSATDCIALAATGSTRARS